MSTSSEFAWQVPAPQSSQVQAFAYPQVGPPAASTPNRWMPQDVPAPVAADPLEMQRREQRAREDGIREGELRARQIFEEALAAERKTVVQAIDEFALERTNYYQRIESEVVQLALAIARKIIHREAQLDPLLLTGAVEVALRGLDRNTRVLMRIHPAHAAEWRAHFTANTSRQIEIIEDASVAKDRCVIQTSLGNTEIGIESQLKEIENGFFDLLAQRPATQLSQTVQ